MIKCNSSSTVELVRASGDDSSVIQAMRVSLGGVEAEPETDGIAGRIRYLMKNRHGSPFEHNSLTFSVKTPIFVAREFMRHRIGWSYNELSARYVELEPEFWIPDYGRPLVQKGKPGAYEFEHGGTHLSVNTMNTMTRFYQETWDVYTDMIMAGVAKEVARAVLPVGTYTGFVATCNIRSLMALLSLRTKHPGAAYPSHPQQEIKEVANQMEELAFPYFPESLDAFREMGSVAP